MTLSINFCISDCGTTLLYSLFSIIIFSWSFLLINISPELKISVNSNTEISIEGIKKSSVGLFAAQIRALRPPEPYKGKGVFYKGEKIIIKPGKSGKK
jgi:hypothetical protein